MKNLGIVLLLLILPWQAHAAAPTYFGSASNPSDNGTGADASTLAITPPANMVAGDLVVMIGQLQDPTTGNITVSATGGQTWSTVSEAAANDMEVAVYWAQYNGTWSTDPSLAFGSLGGTQPATAVMHVFRPATVGTWVLDTAYAGGAEASASPTVVSGITPTKRDNVVLAGWAIPNVSTWGTLSGTGWVAMDTAQWRNTSGSDQSITFAHQLQSSPVATNDVSQIPSTAAAGISFTMAWYNALAPTVTLNTPADASSDADTTPTLNFTGTDGNADTLEYNVQVDTVNTFDSQNTVLGTSVAVPYSDIVGYPTTFTFDTPIALEGSTKYYFVVKRSGSYDATNYYKILYNSLSYPNNGSFFNNSGTWSSEHATIDLLFGTYNESATRMAENEETFPDTQVYYTVLGATGTGQERGQSFTTGSGFNLKTIKIYLVKGGSPTDNLTIEVRPTIDVLNFPLVSAFSATDAGFTAGHPFASGVAKDFTVQVGDTLPAGTYYWRVRAIDPTGSNTYGEWSSTRSFTVTGGGGGGGATPPRGMMLFEGFKIKFTSGRIILYQHN